MESDFSGYATKNNLKCSDGRTILHGAFKDNDQQVVPLVWQHRHNEATNVLGHAVLENRDDGVYTYGFFNETTSGQHAKKMVIHKDVVALSIYANGLVQKGNDVVHGMIREVSLVLSGANPGAMIDNVSIQHSDGYETVADEADIYMDQPLETEIQHADTNSNGGETVPTDDTDTKSTSKADDETVKDVFETMNDKQKNVTYYMIGEALASAGVDPDGDDDDDDDTKEAKHSELMHSINTQIQEGFDNMSRNVFDQTTDGGPKSNSLTHDQVTAIVNDAKKAGSFKEAFLAHAETYGFQDVETLFPDAKLLSNSPEMISRRTEWVSKVISGTKHNPFSRIKTVVADITAEEARARGYVKGNLKKDEIIKLLKRKTEPTTIYKKQKLDRDDILDITDLDIVAWLKAEMRLMLDEEIARAILLGDGRDASDEDKIDEEKIRPISKDDPMYAHPVVLTQGGDVESQIEEIIRGRSAYKGSGTPVMFTTLPYITDMLLQKDKIGRRVYDTQASLAAALMVSEIIPVEVMEADPEVVAIIVNLNDYTVGADKGGNISMFDDFDIDYNQHKYLMETRISGALTKPKSAIVIKRVEGTSVTPVGPSFNSSTNTLTFPSTAGVEYYIDGLEVSGTEVIAEDTTVEARSAEGYYIQPGSTTHWSFVHNDSV